MEWENLKSTSPIKELVVAYLIIEGNYVAKEWIIEYIAAHGFMAQEIEDGIKFLHHQGVIAEYISEVDNKTKVLRYRRTTLPFYCNMSSYAQIRFQDFTGRVYQHGGINDLIQINSDNPKVLNAHSWIAMFILQKLEISCCFCLQNPVKRLEAIAAPICKECKTTLINLPLPAEHEYIYLIRFLRRIKETRILQEDVNVLKTFLREL
jgi:hypothetical protein